VALTAWASLLALSGKYDDLFDLVIFASWILYGMTAAAVLVLRRKRPDMRRPYRTVGYPVVPLAFTFGAIILVVSTAINRPRESIVGLVLIGLGLPFYSYWRKRAKPGSSIY
jgi:APA family basic amino acid/polyamine antiporter